MYKPNIMTVLELAGEKISTLKWQTDESMKKQFLEWFYFDWKEED